MRLIHLVTFLSSIPLTLSAVVEYELNVSPRWLAPDGHWRKTYVINGQTPGPLIECNQGDTLRVLVHNQLSIAISMHWHGQIQRNGWMDGVPGVTQWPILSKDTFRYEFVCEEYGMYWYHTHFLGAYDDGIRGPLFVRPGRDIRRPWPLLSNRTADHDALEQAFQRGIKTMLFSWDHEEAETRVVRLKGAGVLPICYKSILINGIGHVKCIDERIRLTQGAALPEHPAFGSADINGCRTFLPANASLNNAVQCSDTASSYAAFYTSASASDDGKWIVFHLVNSGSEASISFSIDGHDIWIVAADGEFVKPQKVQVVYVIIGVRYTVVVPLNQPRGRYTIRSAFTNYPYQILSGYGVLVVEPRPRSPSPLTRRQLLGATGAKAVEGDQQDLNVTSLGPTAASGDPELSVVSAEEAASRMQSSASASSPLTRRQLLGATGAKAVEGDQQDLNVTSLGPTAASGDPESSVVSAEEAASRMQSSASASLTDPPVRLPASVTSLPAVSPSTKQWQRYNGSLIDGAIQQNPSRLSPYLPRPPPRRAADLTVGVIINATGPLTWVLAPSGNEFQSLRFSQFPILFRGSKFDASDYEGTVFDAHNGSIVDVIFQSNGAPPHPLHKHQTKVWVVATSSTSAGPFPFASLAEGLSKNASLFNMNDPPVRDGWEVPTNGYVVIRYQVTFPSVDLFHCHISHHLSSGMAFVVREGMDLFQLSRIPSPILNAAHVANIRFNSSSNIGLDEI